MKNGLGGRVRFLDVTPVRPNVNVKAQLRELERLIRQLEYAD